VPVLRVAMIADTERWGVADEIDAAYTPPALRVRSPVDPGSLPVRLEQAGPEKRTFVPNTRTG